MNETSSINNLVLTSYTTVTFFFYCRLKSELQQKGETLDEYRTQQQRYTFFVHLYVFNYVLLAVISFLTLAPPIFASTIKTGVREG